jgi:succinate-semialdehyde dehydrogenase / glutarate-semialdehyde dehydrogenase
MKLDPPYDTGRVLPDGALLQRLVALAGVSPGRPRAEAHMPWTGEVWGAIPLGTPEDIQAAAARARAVQPAWAAQSCAARAAIFDRYRDLLLERQAEVLDLIQLETGKARRHAFEEVLDAVLVARYYAARAEKLLRLRRGKGPVPFFTRTVIHHPPRGVVGIIAPWNYPLSLTISDAIPALLAGNAVLLRPDIQTSYTALWALEKLLEAGLPKEVLQVVTGRGHTLGPALIGVADYIAFTGSTAAGRLVARQAGERLIGCSLELGGKNPMLVLADADIDQAVEGLIRGAYSSAGQLCISIERLYVQDTIYAPFIERLVARMRRMVLGGGCRWQVDMGSLLGPKQLSRVQAHVTDAVAKGARLLYGGQARPEIGPYFYEPTLLTDVTPAMQVSAQETFGPVVSVFRFKEIEEAIRQANASEYGLNASVWTRNLQRGREIAARLQAGSVNINDAYATAWGAIDAPMGGFKASGLGRRHGAEGILRFTETQTIAIHRGPSLAAPRWSGEERYARFLTRILKWLKWIR